MDPDACLNKYYVTRRGLWFWDQASSPLSASMFFCLKYLRADEVSPWMMSVFRIESPYWRAQVMVWLLGAHRVLTGGLRQPSWFSLDDDPRIDWEWSHCLTGDYSGLHGAGEIHDFIPAENRRRALEVTKNYFSEAMFLEWLNSISEHPSLEAELAAKPYWFYELYGTDA